MKNKFKSWIAKTNFKSCNEKRRHVGIGHSAPPQAHNRYTTDLQYNVTVVINVIVSKVKYMERWSYSYNVW